MALTKVINVIEAKRKDKLLGKFTCFRGMALKKEVIEKWAAKKEIELDGYSSTSLDFNVAKRFAV